MVSVRGVDYDNEGDGLAGLLAVHFEAARKNGEVILNLNDAAIARASGLKGPKKNDPRPPYVHQPFPKDLHHADGRTRTVASAAEQKTAIGEAFREQPYPVVRVAPADPAAEKAARIAKDAETEGKIASQNELILKLSAQVAELAKK
jgi:hypothetical protein